MISGEKPRKTFSFDEIKAHLEEKSADERQLIFDYSGLSIDIIKYLSSLSYPFDQYASRGELVALAYDAGLINEEKVWKKTRTKLCDWCDFKDTCFSDGWVE